MNYIAEINAFERWLETNPLPISSQLLWYKMMNRFNRSGWSEWIQVENLDLMADLRTKREATMIDVRDSLIKAGLIEYRKGKKGYPGRYRMIPFTFRNEVKTVAESVTKSVTETVAETVDIYKLKQNNKEKNITKKETRHQYGEYQNVLLSDEELEKLKAEFPDYQERIERLSEYCASTGKSYKNYLATIRVWAKKEPKPEREDWRGGGPRL